MRAILFKEGIGSRIYYLEDERGLSEVLVFLTKDHSRKEEASAVNGFAYFIKIISEYGVRKLTRKQCKSWEVKGERFYELRKDPHRIGFFCYEGEKKILLVSHFTKQAMIEKKEYEKATGLKKRFDSDPIWHERG